MDSKVKKIIILFVFVILICPMFYLLSGPGNKTRDNSAQDQNKTISLERQHNQTSQSSENTVPVETLSEAQEEVGSKITTPLEELKETSDSAETGNKDDQKSEQLEKKNNNSESSGKDSQEMEQEDKQSSGDEKSEAEDDVERKTGLAAYPQENQDYALPIDTEFKSDETAADNDLNTDLNPDDSSTNDQEKNDSGDTGQDQNQDTQKSDGSGSKSTDTETNTSDVSYSDKELPIVLE